MHKWLTEHNRQWPPGSTFTDDVREFLTVFKDYNDDFYFSETEDGVVHSRAFLTEFGLDIYVNIARYFVNVAKCFKIALHSQHVEVASAGSASEALWRGYGDIPPGRGIGNSSTWVNSSIIIRVSEVRLAAVTIRMKLRVSTSTTSSRGVPIRDAFDAFVGPTPRIANAANRSQNPSTEMP